MLRQEVSRVRATIAAVDSLRPVEEAIICMFEDGTTFRHHIIPRSRSTRILGSTVSICKGHSASPLAEMYRFE